MTAHTCEAAIDALNTRARAIAAAATALSCAFQSQGNALALLSIHPQVPYLHLTCMSPSGTSKSYQLVRLHEFHFVHSACISVKAMDLLISIHIPAYHSTIFAT
jgi:carotenoid cleavage dioxygenase-like enzyme